VVHAVVERLEQGDCWVDYETLIGWPTRCRHDVADSRDRIEATLDALIEDRSLSCVSLGGRFLVACTHVEDEQDWRVFTTSSAERHLADAAALRTMPPCKAQPAQRRAVELA